MAGLEVDTAVAVSKVSAVEATEVDTVLEEVASAAGMDPAILAVVASRDTVLEVLEVVTGEAATAVAD
jgi:hypothetical protein